jgi:serine/threonine-protein kinase
LQLSKVLEETRRLGIVHRDLKPDNIFLVDSGYELFVKVLDFGIAKRREGGSPGSLTESGTLVGTPHYMSPEALMSSRDVDHRADLWALAVVAYHALTGELPFRGETFAALSVKIHEARFAPPSSLRAELTADVDAWFKVALCRLPEHRFSSAAELARSFRTACGALTTSEERRGDRDDTLPETADAPIAPSEREEARETPVPPASITIEPELDSGLPSRERSQLQHTLVSAAEDEEERPSAARRSAFAAAASRARGASRRWPLWLAALALGGALAAIAQRQIEAPSLAAKIHLAPAPGERAAELREPPAPTPVADSDPPPPSAAPPPRPSQWASPPPADSSPQPTPPTASAPDCAQPFTTNEHGDLVPRPECFR